MKASINSIREVALTLPPSERASLAHQLILSLEGPDSLALDSEQETAIRARVQRVHEGKAKMRPAEDMFAAMKAESRWP